MWSQWDSTGIGLNARECKGTQRRGNRKIRIRDKRSCLKEIWNKGESVRPPLQGAPEGEDESLFILRGSFATNPTECGQTGAD